jgi:hypothetical protein
MPEADLFLLFVRPINRARIRYMIGGSVAVIFYGEPRLTHDVDLIAFLSAEEISRLGEIFPSSEFYVPPTEVMAIEANREQRGSFNIIHSASGFKADIYLTGRDPLNAWGFRGRRAATFEGEQIMLAPPEYVIVRKLEFFREGGSEKHIRDIRSMLRMSNEQIDRGALTEWIDRLGLQPEWQRVVSGEF